MIITRETDYALRILRALSDGKQATAEEICEEEMLPKQFVYKIIKKLEKVGLVQIIRGVHGGYRLVGDLTKVTMYDLIGIMDSEVVVCACVRPGYRCGRREVNDKMCKVHSEIQALQAALDKELKARTLDKLVCEGA